MVKEDNMAAEKNEQDFPGTAISEYFNHTKMYFCFCIYADTE